MKALNGFQALGNHDLYHTLFEPREMASASRKSHQNNQQDDGSSEVSRSWTTKQSTFFPHFFQVLAEIDIDAPATMPPEKLEQLNHLVPLSEVGREFVFQLQVQMPPDRPSQVLWLPFHLELTWQHQAVAVPGMEKLKTGSVTDSSDVCFFRQLQT